MFKSSFSVIARTQHPRVRYAEIGPGDTIPLDLFCDLGHVVFSSQGNSSALGDRALERVGRRRRVAIPMPVFSGVYRAVAASDLVALLPTALAHHIAPAAGLDAYLPPMPVHVAEIAMIWLRRLSSSPAHVWLRDQFGEILRPLCR